MAEEEAAAPPAAYLSPVAEPLLSGKALKRSLRLIQAISAKERQSRSRNKEGEVKQRKPLKLLRRGVQEVTKSLRKGEGGIVFFASDVHPVEIIAHLPILCEEKGVAYAYICPKRALGHAFRSKRPASVIMVVNPANCPLLQQAAAAADAEAAEEEEEQDLQGAFAKVEKTIRKAHPCSHCWLLRQAGDDAENFFLFISKDL
ncbi:hypothetical protein Efla_000230 [Eimeria flavescens]